MIFMKYSFSCPANCNYEISVDAKSVDEAVAEIIKEGVVHGKEVHPGVLSMTEEQLRNLVRASMIEGWSTVKLVTGAVLGFWFVLVFLFGEKGAFVQPPQVPPFPILLGATVPLVVFVAAYLGSEAFRARNHRTLVAI
jgi:predicted small metal-binding protein